MLIEFIATAYRLAVAGEWALLKEYFELVRDLLTQPTMTIKLGQPKDKEIT